jgi:hypothetical protein
MVIPLEAAQQVLQALDQLQKLRGRNLPDHLSRVRIDQARDDTACFRMHLKGNRDPIGPQDHIPLPEPFLQMPDL